jgi:hypothetical protein
VNLRFNKGLQDLRASKIDRATFSNLLFKLATHLKQESVMTSAAPKKETLNNSTTK